MPGIVPSLVVLGLLAVVAAVLASGPLTAEPQARRKASLALLLTSVVQAAHFAEEWATGFAVRFPELLGLDPMPGGFFVSFNLAWLAAWLAAVPLLRTGRRAALFAAWFLALAAMLNGIAHPLLAVVAGGYFPGLISSPLVGALGVLLCARLSALRTR